VTCELSPALVHLPAVLSAAVCAEWAASVWVDPAWCDGLVRHVAAERYPGHPAIERVQASVSTSVPGDSANWHTDPARPFTGIVYLSADHEGGELVVDGHEPLRPGVGDFVAIRAGVGHRVEQVTRGERHTVLLTPVGRGVS
jgi:predicted 2-oxoglutarate/Fe(II)-dependent dioxygenase YbiX